MMMVPPFFSVSSMVLLASTALASNSSLPIVDLGYECHQAIRLETPGNFYNFSNIRFAQPPIGNLRFRAPVPPTGRNPTINNGSIGRICPQASGAWHTLAQSFMINYLQGIPFDYDAAAAKLLMLPSNVTRPRESEDCLFLDVYVPESQFTPCAKGEGFPVLVWIYGGGYTTGEKTGNGKFNPTGIYAAAGKEFIWVAINYRLGAFGFSAGPSVQADGTANAGLYDQRLALKWVQDNIHLFGGNKNDVTVFGKSAGAGSIVHQITAFGGNNADSPFKKAIISSPAFDPRPLPDEPEQTFQDFLKLLNVSTLAEARQLDSATLMRANSVQIYTAPYGSGIYGPVVDGTFAPELPGKLLAEGKFDKNVEVMTAHNSDEGLLFTPPLINSSETTLQFAMSAFPHMSQESLDYLNGTLYPEIFDGSQGYSTFFERAKAMVADASFVCNAKYLDWAYNNQTYNWLFSVYPGYHGQDQTYIYYTNGTSASSDQTYVTLMGRQTLINTVNTTVAFALQDYISSFVVDGKPVGAGYPDIPSYGSESSLVDLSGTGIVVAPDDIVAARCRWWQEGLYY